MGVEADREGKESPCGEAQLFDRCGLFLGSGVYLVGRTHAGTLRNYAVMKCDSRMDSKYSKRVSKEESCGESLLSAEQKPCGDGR
jgi:hypothetical protein